MSAAWRNWLAGFDDDSYVRQPPLILINGLAEQPESWFRNLSFWRRHFEVYLPNLLVYDGPALHQRLAKRKAITVDYLVEQLHLYLDSFVQTLPYHLVAASLGGKIAVEYAVRYPDRVSRLVLLCPSGMGDEERLPIVAGVRRNDPRSLIESVFHDPSRIDPGLLRYYRQCFANRRWRRGFVQTARDTRNHCIRERLAELAHPTLVVSGLEDKIVDSQTAARAAKLLPQGRHLCIPRCGHAPQMERPRLINRLVWRFLTSALPALRQPFPKQLPMPAHTSL